MTPFRRRVAAAMLSALAALFVLEFGVRWHVEGGPLRGLASFVGDGAGGSAAAGSTWLAPDPDLGYVLNSAMPGINSLGLRGEEVAPERTPGVLRILVLGDSISYDRGGWVELLEERLESAVPVEVVNASIPGYTTYQERLLFERRLAHLAPDQVLIQHCLNDNHRFLHHLGPDGERLYTPEARRAMVADGDGVLDWLGRHSYLVVELRRRLLMHASIPDAREPWEHLEAVRTAWEDASWVDYERELAQLRAAVGAAGGALRVISFPLESQLVSERLDEDRAWVRRPQDQLLAVCARLDVPAIDLFEPFLAAQDGGEVLFRDGLHLTPDGHGLAATRVAEALAFLR